MSFFAVFSHLAFSAWPLSPEGDEGYGTPPLDVYETATDVMVELELPGTAADAVRITCDGETLCVEGTKGETVPREGDAAGGRFHCVERTSGPFRRHIQLPVGVHGERARARFWNGVLIIALPKVRP